jgi:hypothetical protein
MSRLDIRHGDLRVTHGGGGFGPLALLPIAIAAGVAWGIAAVIPVLLPLIIAVGAVTVICMVALVLIAWRMQRNVPEGLGTRHLQIRAEAVTRIRAEREREALEQRAPLAVPAPAQAQQVPQIHNHFHFGDGMAALLAQQAPVVRVVPEANGQEVTR